MNKDNPVRYPLVSSGVQEIAKAIEENTRNVLGGDLAEPFESGRYTFWEQEGHVQVRAVLANDNYYDLGGNPRLSSQDVIAINFLKSYGSWSVTSRSWSFVDSDSIASLFALFKLLPTVYKQDGDQRLEFVDESIKALLEISWCDEGAFLALTLGGQNRNELELIGEPPFWVISNNQVLKIHPASVSLATLFKRTARLFISTANLIPLLEVLDSNQQSVLEFNTPLKPSVRYLPATPIIDLALKTTLSTSEDIAIIAKIGFKLEGVDSPNGRVINVPLQLGDQQFSEELRGLGFQKTEVPSRYLISEDAALNLIDSGKDFFPKEWEINGLEEILQKIQISNVQIKIDLKESSSDNSREAYSCDLVLLQNGVEVPFRNLFRSGLQSNRQWVKLSNGSYAKIPMQDVELLTFSLGLSDSTIGLSSHTFLPISAAQVLSLLSKKENAFTINLDESSQRLYDRFNLISEGKLLNPPKNFNGTLREYQLRGLTWLKFLSEFGFGGILADEMGLGKTIQTLALLQTLKEENFSPYPSIIISPTSVLRNWENEIIKFTPQLKTLVLHGLRRKDHYNDLASYDIVLSTYPLMRIDSLQLKKVDWNYVILDEAQYIKNPSSSTAKAVKALNAKCRLALTGTPTENRTLELWSILDFLIPGFLGTRENFTRKFEKRLMTEENNEEVLSVLQSKVAPFILRRTKNVVEKELPPKIESTLPVEMLPSQVEIYNQVTSELKNNLILSLKSLNAKRFTVLSALMRLRQICNHPKSVISLRDRHDLESGKFNLFKSLLLEAVDNNHKVLVFSQFIEMLKIMKGWLDSKEIEHCYLDGSIKDRQILIDDFNSNERKKVFLISLKAGGTGLNLIAADTVILYDPWWNPAVENQAIDRAHRIGQKKVVNVYRLVTKDSIEERIFKLKESKTKLFSALLSHNSTGQFSLSNEDLEVLFSLAPTDT
jgi:SNF2 family DNA or RNA helicase